MNKTKRFLAGFALPGMLHIGFGSLVLFSASSLLHPHNWLNQIAVSPRLTRQARNATDLLSQDIRGASSVQSAAANQIVLRTSTGNVGYTYNAVARTLIRSEGARSETLLTSVDSFSFSLFQRPGIHEAFNSFTPATAENAKLVACRWSSSQKVAGAKLDSDSFQMAPTFLRGR